MNSFLIKCALFISLFLAACSSEDYESVRIGNSEDYESVRIGNQVWMTRNLNRDIGGSFCYDNDSLNCEKYGRLYTWKAAQNACPEGWRLPTHADFRELEKNAMGIDSGNVASVLKSSEWESSGKKNAFNAIPAGYGYFTLHFADEYEKMKFIAQSGASMFWSSTGSDSIAELWYLAQGEKEIFYSRSSFMNYGLFALSVRCVKNNSAIAILSKNDSLAMLEKEQLIEYWERKTMSPYFQSCSESGNGDFNNYIRFPNNKYPFYINNDLFCPNNRPCGDIPECQKFCKGPNGEYYVLHGYLHEDKITRYNLKENLEKKENTLPYARCLAKRIECLDSGVNVVYYKSIKERRKGSIKVQLDTERVDHPQNKDNQELQYDDGDSEFFSYDKFQ
ncbi:MAG: hypothetical protein MJZ03_04840 [archaeon]|nr:hypothetical protein [archaeon]